MTNPKQPTPGSWRVGPGRETEVVLGRPWAEALVEALDARGYSRALILSSGRRGQAEALGEALGPRVVGSFDEAAQHVPRALAERAQACATELEADVIVAIGGGSVIGLGKAINLLRTRAGQARLGFVVLPTTYAGSEMTSIWGLGEDGGKTVGRDDEVRAEVVLYDPVWTLTLPATIAVPSLFNAMAHSVDALFPLEGQADEAGLGDLAERSIAELAEALAGFEPSKDDEDASADSAGLEALAGAQKAGELLDRAGMSLHHALAHVLGGSFGLAHAPTHTVLLPHVIAFMAEAAPQATARLARALGSEDPAAALWDLQARVGAPQQLGELGFGRADIEAALERLGDKQVDSPRPLGGEAAQAALRELLVDAWLGRRASTQARRLPAPTLSDSTHAGLRPALAGAPLTDESTRAAILLVHGRGSTAEAMIAKLEGLLGDSAREGLAIVAVQADSRTWYDHGFTAALEQNQAKLDSALELLAAVRETLAADVDPRKILMFGFSQGACLLVDYLARSGGPLAGAVAIAGGLIGPEPSGPWHRGDHLEGVPIVLGVANEDSWVPRPRVETTADWFESRGALVTRLWAPGDAHTITPAQAAALRELVGQTLASA